MQEHYEKGEFKEMRQCSMKFHQIKNNLKAQNQDIVNAIANITSSKGVTKRATSLKQQQRNSKVQGNKDRVAKGNPIELLEKVCDNALMMVLNPTQFQKCIKNVNELF